MPIVLSPPAVSRLSWCVALYFVGSRALMARPFVALSELVFAAPVVVFAGCVFAFAFAFEVGAG